MVGLLRGTPGDDRLAERVERVVGRELLRHVVVVVFRHGLEPRRQRVEPGRLGRELTGLRVRAPDDKRQRLQGPVLELVLVEERVERAPFVVMAELDAGDVVGGRRFTFGDLAHLVRGYKQKGRLFVDEPADQPGPGNPMDPSRLSSNPFHGVSLRYVVSASLRCRPSGLTFQRQQGDGFRSTVYGVRPW